MPETPAASATRDGTIRWLAVGEHDLPADESWLSPVERARLGRMRFTKRRMDFLVARASAKRALAAWLGRPPAADLEVRHARTGAPRPYVAGRPLEDVALSLTDRAGWAVCVLASGVAEVGCDLELVEPRSDAFVRDYFTVAERDAVAVAGRDAHAVLANLIWSAKESALKVLETGLRRDTRSVEIDLGGAVDPTPGGWRPLLATTREGEALPGWWARCGVFLLTVTARGAAAPPAALPGGGDLAAAVPTHSWLARPRVPAAG